MTEPARRIVFLGTHGQYNIGDELLLDTFLTQLGSQHHYVVNSYDPEFTRAQLARRFDVEVIDGDIQIWVPEGRWRYVSQTPRDDTINAQLNDGDNPVLLRASEGDIRIAVVPDPTSYGPIR